MLELGIANNQLETAAELAGLSLEAAKNLLNELSDLTEDFDVPLARSELQNLPIPQKFHFQIRQQSVVFIPSLDRFGKLLAHALAHSGIGKLIIGDNTLVTEADCGRLGFLREQIGKSKLSAIKSELANAPCEIKLDNRMSGVDYSEVDIAVVEATGAFQPADYQRWLSLTRNQVGVCFSDKHVLVTSVVRENEACLGCRELNKWDKDPSRKMVCSQIAGIAGVKNSSSVMFAASFTAQRIVNEIDGGKATDDIQFWQTGSVVSVIEEINPGCGCQQAPGEI